MNNLFAALPGGPSGELIETLVSASSVRIERIVSHGNASPEGFWYDQAEDEWVVVLQGHARLAFAGATDEVDLHPGDHVHIPAHRRHRVAWTDPEGDTVWLAVFFTG